MSGGRRPDAFFARIFPRPHAAKPSPSAALEEGKGVRASFPVRIGLAASRAEGRRCGFGFRSRPNLDGARRVRLERLNAGAPFPKARAARDLDAAIGPGAPGAAHQLASASRGGVPFRSAKSRARGIACVWLATFAPEASVIITPAARSFSRSMPVETPRRSKR